MSLSYPLTMPSHNVRRIELGGESVVGVSTNPFTLQTQRQVWPGQGWRAHVTLPPMRVHVAAAWVAWLMSLNGMQGSFLMGDPLRRAPRGTAAGSPTCTGTVGSQEMTITGGSGQLLAGDYLQVGSGSTAKLYLALKDVNLPGTADVWPAVRATGAITLVSPVGKWRLAANDMKWNAEHVATWGLEFDAVEDQ